MSEDSDRNDGDAAGHHLLCLARPCTCEPNEDGHLPNCVEFPCICRRLRQAEDRVLVQVLDEVTSIREIPFSTPEGDTVLPRATVVASIETLKRASGGARNETGHVPYCPELPCICVDLVLAERRGRRSERESTTRPLNTLLGESHGTTPDDDDIIETVVAALLDHDPATCSDGDDCRLCPAIHRYEWQDKLATEERLYAQFARQIELAYNFNYWMGRDDAAAAVRAVEDAVSHELVSKREAWSAALGRAPLPLEFEVSSDPDGEPPFADPSRRPPGSDDFLQRAVRVALRKASERVEQLQCDECIDAEKAWHVQCHAYGHAAYVVLVEALLPEGNDTNKVDLRYGLTREQSAAMDVIWNDDTIDDEERAVRLSEINGARLEASRDVIAKVRAFEGANIPPSDLDESE